MATPEGLASKVDGGLVVGVSSKVSPETFLVSDKKYRLADLQNHLRKNRKSIVFKINDFLVIIIVQFR